MIFMLAESSALTWRPPDDHEAELLVKTVFLIFN